MRVIIGGAEQGKLFYAKTTFFQEESIWCDGRVCSKQDILHASCVYHLESFIKREIEKDHCIDSLAEEIIEHNPNIYIVTDEIGMGIVPMEEKERYYREMTGRICTKLCGYATRVDRVFYGIGTVIKNDQNTPH